MKGKKSNMLQTGIKGVQIGSKQKSSRFQTNGSANAKQPSIHDAMCGQSPMPKTSNKHGESFESNMLKQQERDLQRTRVKLGAEGEINLLKTKELDDATPGVASEVDNRASLLFKNQGEDSNNNLNQNKTVLKNDNQQIQFQSGSASVSSVRGGVMRSNTTFVAEFEEGINSSARVLNITSQYQLGANRDVLVPVAQNHYFQSKQGVSKIQGLMKQPNMVAAQAQFSLTGTKKSIGGVQKKLIPKETKNSGTGQPSSCIVSQSPIKLGSKYSLSGSRQNSPNAQADLKSRLLIKEQTPMASPFDDSQPSISQSHQKMNIPQIDEVVDDERDQEDATHEQVDGTYRAVDASHTASGKVKKDPQSPSSQNMITDKSDMNIVRAKEVQIVDLTENSVNKQNAEQPIINEASYIRTPVSHERKQTDHESVKSTGLQSNQAKRGLQALETSGEDIGPILQDIKLMQQIGQTSGSEGRESPNPGQWKQDENNYQVQTSMFNIKSSNQQPKQEAPSSSSPRIQEIIINADQIPMKVSRKGLKGYVSPRSSQGNTSVERAMTADRNTQRDSKISKEEVYNPNDRQILSGNGYISNQYAIRSKRNGSVGEDIRPKNLRQMQKSAQAKRATNHHTSGGHRRKHKDDFEPQARSRQQTRLFNALSDRGALNIHPGTVEIISKENNSVCGGTVTSEEFSANFDQNFIEKISKSQNNFAQKLSKNANLGVVYNQIALEKRQIEKKQFAEVALKTTFLPGQRIQNEKFQQLANQLKDEKEIQEMNCKAFLRYLELNPKKRKTQLLQGKEREGSPNLSMIVKSKQQGEQKKNNLLSLKSYQGENESMQPNMKAGSTIGQNTADSPIQSLNQLDQDKFHPAKFQKGKSLNKYKFRNQNFFNQESKTSKQGDYHQIKSNSSKRNSSGFGFVGGMSNYDFALKQKAESGAQSSVNHNRSNTNWNIRRDLFSADRATRRPKQDIVPEKKSQDEETNQLNDDNMSFIASHDYSRDNQANQHAQKAEFFQNQQVRQSKQQAQRPLNAFGQQSNQQISNVDSVMVGKKKSLLTMRDDSKSIYDLENPNLVHQQLFDKSTKSIHTDKQALGKNIKLSRDNLDFMNQLDVPDYEDQFMDPNIDYHPQTGDPKTMVSKGNLSIFDSSKRQKVGKQASVMTPGNGQLSALTPQKHSKKVIRGPAIIITEKLDPVPPRSQSPININTSNKNTFRQKLIKSINKDKAITYDIAQQHINKAETKSVSSYGVFDSMSPDVDFQNELADQLSKQIDQLRMQPILEVENEDGDENKTISTTQGQMALMHKEIKIINQVCQRLVTASDEYPTLYVGASQDIELSPGVHLFYRFNLMDLPSPLKFEIQYHDNVLPHQSNLEILLSTTDKNPDFVNHEIKIYSLSTYFLQADKLGVTSAANQLKEAEKNKKGGSTSTAPKIVGGNDEITFKDKYLYVCLNSYSGCSITLTIKNIVSRQTINKLKLTEYKKQKEIAYEFAANAFNDSDSYVREMKKMEAQRMEIEKQHKDYMKQVGFASFYPDHEKTLLKIDSKKERTQEIIQNQQQRNQFEYKKRIFQLQKWQILQKIRSESFVDYRSKYLAIFYSTNFIKFQKTIKIINVIWKEYVAKRLEVKKNQTAAMLAIILGVQLKARRKKRGKDIKSRLQKKLKFCFTSMTPSLYAVKYQKALELLKPFFLQLCTAKMLVKKKYECELSIQFIEKMLKDRKIQKNKDNYAISESLWVNEAARIRTYVTDKNNKVTTRDEIIKKVLQSGTHKEFVLTVFKSRRKLEQEIVFMEWYIKMKENEYDINPDKFDKEKDPDLPYTIKYKNYQSRLPVYKEVLKITDDFLKKGPDKEKWIQKMSRIAKPKKTNKSKSKEKKKKEVVLLNSQDMTNLIKVNLGLKVQKEEERVRMAYHKQLPFVKLITNYKSNQIVQLIMKSAYLKEKAIKDFRTQFETTNCGTITWDFFEEKEETRHKFRIDMIPECYLCKKQKVEKGEDKWRAARDKEWQVNAQEQAKDIAFITQQEQ